MLQHEKVINSPNLPMSQVRSILINNEYIDLISESYRDKYNFISVNKNEYINSTISSHADINFCHIDRNILFCTEKNMIDCLSVNFEVKYIRGDISEKYPADVKLNCVTVGKYLICNPKTVAREILQYAEISDKIIIPVNQGYSKCSVCVVNENCIITDDESIYKSAQNFLNDVILVSKGSVQLKGMNYGFIGGATGKTDKNKLAFYGRIESHTDHNIIIDTLHKYRIVPEELYDGPLTDVGSLLPLTEIY